LGPVWGMAAFGVLVVAAVGWVGAQDRLALRAGEAAPLAAHRHPRAHNLAEALAQQLGVPAPELFLLPTARVNALACRRRSRFVLALSAGLLESCTRTELEAAIVSLIQRAEGNQMGLLRLAAAFGSFAGPWRERDPGADVRTAAVTRYPPAVTALLRKLDPEPGRYAPFYLAGARDSLTTAQRAALVADL
jgi:hypothetical protein